MLYQILHSQIYKLNKNLVGLNLFGQNFGRTKFLVGHNFSLLAIWSLLSDWTFIPFLKFFKLRNIKHCRHYDEYEEFWVDFSRRKKIQVYIIQ